MVVTDGPKKEGDEDKQNSFYVICFEVWKKRSEGPNVGGCLYWRLLRQKKYFLVFFP